MGSEYSFFWRKTCQIKFIIHGHVHPNSPKICCQILQKAADQVWSYFILRTNYLAGICGHYHESSVCLEYTKKFLPKQINLQNFLTPKNLGIKNFKLQTILRSLLSLEIWSAPRELSQASFSKQDKVRSL